ncbi:MAG: YigZ family protein [Ignavibacterium sp.]|nr:MAG: YigZ family protein [Ignavibacterium sp.]
MNYPEEIITVDNFSEFSTKEKDSSFIGQVYHCETEKDVNETLTSVKKKYYDATHHCYAYRLLDQKFKYSDDGEPSGSAGLRILNAIDQFKLFNVIVIVIRYYGGTKLGVGSLGKAYYNSALKVLENAERISKTLYKQIFFESSFDNVSHIHKAISNHQAIIVSSDYSEKAIFECWIKPAYLNGIKSKLTDVSKGRIKVFVKEDLYYYK